MKKIICEILIAIVLIGTLLGFLYHTWWCLFISKEDGFKLLIWWFIALSGSFGFAFGSYISLSNIKDE